MSDDLVTWLRARLDEDERIATAAADNDGNVEWRVTHSVLDGQRTIRTAANRPVARTWERDGEADDGWTFRSKDVAIHIARQDPARLLAEVAAKRAILDAYAWSCSAESPD